MKLSKRLKHIENMVEDGYAHIWDCCCDHGFLGTRLLQNTIKNQIEPTIHYVDIVPELINAIEKKLHQFYPDLSTHWKTHCIDVATLPLAEQTPKGKHLIIIAGVGGDLMGRMIKAIHADNSTLRLDFLLCPTNRQYALRQQLIALDFGLKDEVLIEEKGRIYEILLLSNTTSSLAKVSAIGDKIWQSETAVQAVIAKRYVKKTLGYYEAIQTSESHNTEDIIKAYKSVNIDMKM